MTKRSRGMWYRVWFSFVVMGVILLTGIYTEQIPASTGEGNENFANLVIFVDFTDSSHDHSSRTGYDAANCPAENIQKTIEIFDGDGNYGSNLSERSLKSYLNKISYGELRVKNDFPQSTGAEDADARIVMLALAGSADAYVDNYDKIVGEIVKAFSENGEPVENGSNWDLDNDGCIDNITIVVSDYLTDGTYAPMNGRQQNYGGNGVICGKRISNYTVVSESDVYFGISGSGLVIHEFMHSLGYPDLYERSSDGENPGVPVGPWDIMSQVSYRVQYPLAYMRQYISGWLDLPVVMESQEGYSLLAASETTVDTKDQQAVILKTPYSDTEFFVVEFRKKGEVYEGQDYDANIPGSGIIIYRINTSFETNFLGAPFQVYVYRPGDSYDEKGHEKADTMSGNLSDSYLSAESDRTSYGMSDLTKTLSDGAITYSDGRNSGIVISNVGSAEGSRITFDITFPDAEEADYWTMLTSGHEHEQTVWMTSCMDSSGVMYFIKKEQKTGLSYLYQYDMDGWTKLGDVPDGNDYSLCVYDGEIYTFYLESSGYHAVLAQWNGSGWVTRHTTETAGVTGIEMVSDATGIYCAYDVDSQNINAFRYTAGRIENLGTAMNGNTYGANGIIAVSNGVPAVVYREWTNNNNIRVKFYRNGTWADLGTLNLSSDNAVIRSNGDYFYLAAGSPGADQKSVYRLDITAENLSWEAIGSGSFSDKTISDMDMCFQGGSPYILYFGGSDYRTQVKTLDNDQWVAYGAALANEHISNLHAYTYNGQMYITYLNMVNHQVYVRTHEVSDSSGLTNSGTGEADYSEELYTDLQGICYILNDSSIDVGAVYTSNDPNVSFRWLAYDLKKQEWILISDWSNGNWATWKPGQGDYWLHVETRTSDGKVSSQTACFRSEKDYTCHSLELGGICYINREHGIDVGVVYTSDDPEVSFRWLAYDLKKQEWLLISDWSDGNWATWKPEQGDYWLRVEAVTTDGKTSDQTICFTSSKDYLHHSLELQGICDIVQNYGIDAGVAYTSSDPEVLFRWLAYDLEKQEWILISDWGKGNWITWKPEQGNYWLRVEAKTSDGVTEDLTVCYTTDKDYR